MKYCFPPMDGVFLCLHRKIVWSATQFLKGNVCVRERERSGVGWGERKMREGVRLNRRRRKGGSRL